VFALAVLAPAAWGQLAQQEAAPGAPAASGIGRTAAPAAGSRLPTAPAQGAPAPASPAPPRLEDAVWQLYAYRTDLGLKPAVAGAGNGYVAFDNGGFQINAGCDTLRGSYWLEGSRLLFSPHVASMVGDCPPTLRAQEEAVLALLPAIARLYRSDRELVLLDDAGVPLLTLVAPDKSPLQRRVWLLLTYRDDNDLIVPALPAPTFTLRFENATQLAGVACDEYRGGFVRDERFLELEGPIATSRVGCKDPAVARQAEEYLDALGRVHSYRVDAQSLLLRDADGRMIARFAAAALPPENGSAGAADADRLPPAPAPLPITPREDIPGAAQPGVGTRAQSGTAGE
jgi:heat shock protein HslJ